MRVLRVEVDVDAHDARADRAGGFAHKRVGFPARRRGGGGRGDRRVSASGRVRFRFVFSRRRRRAAREALEVVEPRRGQGEHRARLRRRRARAGGRLRRGPGGGRERRPQLHQRRSRRHERRGERRPPPRRPSRGRLPGARGWLGVRADTRTETRRRRTRNGCARGGEAGTTREGCDAASVDVHRTFSAPGKKSAFTDAANTQGRSPHRAVRVSAKRLRRLLPRARRDVAPVETATPQTRAYLSHKESSQLSPNEKISGFAVRASRNSSASVLSLGSSRVPSSSQRACRASPLGASAVDPARASRA